MAENPYAPPAAEVADVSREASLERPQIVTIGIWLLWLQVLVSIPAPVITAFSSPDEGPAARRYFRLVLVLLIIGFMALLTFRAGQGRNWARIGQLILLILRIASLVASYLLIRRMFPDQGYSPFSFQEPLQAVLFLLNHLLSFAAVAMLFTPAGNDWYRAMRMSR
jgi:hypothetical protein